MVTVVVLAIATLCVVSILVGLPNLRGLALCGLPALFGIGAWLLYRIPRLEMAEHGITVVNPFVVVELPWDSIVRTDTKWGLGFVARNLTVTVWALAEGGGWRKRSKTDPEAAVTPAAQEVVAEIQKQEFLRERRERADRAATAAPTAASGSDTVDESAEAGNRPGTLARRSPAWRSIGLAILALAWFAWGVLNL